MPIRLDIWSDFVCPYCYFVSFTLEKLRTKYDLEFHWHAYELRPAGMPPVTAENLASVEARRPEMEEKVRKDFGVEWKRGPIGINTHAIHQLSKYVAEQGKDHEFHLAGLRAYFSEARDVHDPKVMIEIAAQVGVQVDNLEEILNNPLYEEQVAADIAEIKAMEGFRGVPTMLFANEFVVIGDQPIETIEEAIKKALATQAK